MAIPLTTVLVVEDDPAVRRLACRLLESLGYRVLAAYEGEEAVRLVRADTAGDIRVVLSDVWMPGMDGRTLAAVLAALRPEVKVILMSGEGGAETEGAGFLFKPFTAESLEQAVRRALGGA